MEYLVAIALGAIGFYVLRRRFGRSAAYRSLPADRAREADRLGMEPADMAMIDKIMRQSKEGKQPAPAETEMQMRGQATSGDDR